MMERFGEFELHRQLGSGGMADVFAARRPTETGPAVCAIKLIRPQAAQDPNYRGLFLREGKLAMRMRHGNLVSVYDVGEHDGFLFMVMELVDGVSLDRFLQQVRGWHPDRPNLDEAVHIAGQLLRALHHVHTDTIDEINQRVVHRDVSPQNVMVTSSGEVKLADFGVARVMDGHNTNRVYGKLPYMPREQYKGSPVQQSDLFAVGAILYEMITGRRLRAHCHSRADLHEAIMSDGVPELPEDLPSEVGEVLAGLLEPEPTRRMQSAKDALRLLGSRLSRGDIDLDLEELYLDCIDSRHSWYTDLTAQAQAPAEIATQKQLRRGRSDDAADGASSDAADEGPASAPPKDRRPSDRPRATRAATRPGRGTRAGSDAPKGERTAAEGNRGKRAADKATKTKRAVGRAKKGKRAANKKTRYDRVIAQKVGIDTEAPIPGRPWEPAQGHTAALDEVTTVPWIKRIDGDPVPEVRP